VYVKVDGVLCEVQLVDRVDGFVQVRDPRGVVMRVALTDLAGEDEGELAVAKDRTSAKDE